MNSNSGTVVTIPEFVFEFAISQRDLKGFKSQSQTAIAYQADEPKHGAFLFEGEWEPVNEVGLRKINIPTPDGLVLGIKK